MDGAIQEISQSLSAEWILRIDDDELASKGLISFISDRVDNFEMEVVGFRRFQCAISKNGKGRGHRQFRLFPPRQRLIL
jgi:hypothetical protein